MAAGGSPLRTRPQAAWHRTPALGAAVSRDPLSTRLAQPWQTRHPPCSPTLPIRRRPRMRLQQLPRSQRSASPVLPILEHPDCLAPLASLQARLQRLRLQISTNLPSMQGLQHAGLSFGSGSLQLTPSHFGTNVSANTGQGKQLHRAYLGILAVGTCRSIDGTCASKVLSSLLLTFYALHAFF